MTRVGAIGVAALACACEGKVAPSHEGPSATTPTPAPVAAAPAKPFVVPECPRLSPARRVGELAHPAILEASGIVASRRQPGVLWVHNDSGDGPHVYAIDASGASFVDVTFGGAIAIDWEDIAIGPGSTPDRDALYLGDIGDNSGIREHVTVYRVDEPTVPRTGERAPDIEVDGVAAFDLRYPDIGRDAEALLVDPRSGELYIVTKQPSKLIVFRAPMPLRDETVLEHVATLEATALRQETLSVTGGEISADGSLVGLRTPFAAFAWRRVGDEPIAAALARAPCALDQGDATPGEAFAWLPDGEGFVLVNEGRHTPVWRSDRVR